MAKMEAFANQFAAIFVVFFVTSFVMMKSTEAAHHNKVDHVTCSNRGSKCFYKYLTCPSQCPEIHPKDPTAQACFLDCYSPKCEAVCKSRKPNCDGPGAACYDPRFIGGDGIVFYFHGKKNEHFTLISDTNLQINAHFIGLRPLNRTRDFTWIQALGIMFGPHNFTIAAAAAETWDDQTDHLEFRYDGASAVIPQGQSSQWTSPDGSLKLERTFPRNSATVTVSDIAEVSANVVPVTEQESAIHGYGIPANNSFAHLEVQFRFFSLSPRVDGILGRTYRPDFQNPAKPGVEMAVVGGEDKFRTSSLLAADCNSCVFAPGNVTAGVEREYYGTVDCATGGTDGGYGIMCKK
nr:BMP-binding endothelial regulator protein [Ipomoea batatas]GME17691.1 BMP-binding endothelial regulator protein [Ipomoea batatas]